MKISTRLRYNAAASVVLVCLLFVLLLSFSQSMKKQIATYNYANELLHKTSTLNALTHEYLMKHDQRSEKQWRYQFNDIMDSLNRHEDSDPMTRVRNNLDMLKNHYNKLNIEIQALKAMDPKAISEEESKRFKFSKRLLSDQMQICSQRILTHVFRITTEASQKLNELRTRSIYVLLLFGGFMVFITVLNAFTTLNRIARPLADLVKQVNVLEKTDFSKGILQETMWDTPNKNDEVGRLWAAFGDMKIRLAKAFRKINRELKDRQAAEQEVRERNAQLKELQDMLESIINSMPSMLVGIDSDGRITHWNSEAERQINLNMAQAKGQYLQDLLPALRPWLKKAKGTIKEGKPFKSEKQPLEIHGKEIHADITLFPLVSGRRSGAVIRVDDVSERVAMDEIIIQSEKMLSVGGLAAGVAHEINNPLAGILQNMQVVINRLSTELPKNKAVAEKCNTSMEAVNAYLEAREIMRLLSLIRDSGERASAIVDNMLSFSRMNRSQPERRSLAELTDKTLELAASDYDLKKKYDFRSIKIMRDYEDSLPEVMCEAGKIQQVMLNLFKNAAQAMINGSSKSINPEIRLGLHRNGDMVDIEVEDNGPGVPEEIRSKIFEPFFTTKEVGEGTGLGLFVAYFIVVNNHHGSMRVESSPGKGAKFIVQLPIEQSGK